MMALGPRAKTTNINCFIQLLGYNMEHEQNQNISIACHKAAAPECLVNKAGVSAYICSIARLAFTFLQSKQPGLKLV